MLIVTRPFANFFLDMRGSCAGRKTYSRQMCVRSKRSFSVYFFHHNDSPFVNELLQSSTFRHQLRTLAPQSHEGQDGQQVVCTAVTRDERGEQAGKENKSK